MFVILIFCQKPLCLCEWSLAYMLMDGKKVAGKEYLENLLLSHSFLEVPPGLELRKFLLNFVLDFHSYRLSWKYQNKHTNNNN